ncbi:MAG: hypothetical protein QOH06_3635 [Acidobacteriota bacterium]|jgi:hypothetical protein|nr:hypothetical protein [Acidobacteriota bacterium]
MLSLEECRKILGDEARGLSDADLELLRQQLYGLADIAISCFLTRRDEGVTFPSEATATPPNAPERNRSESIQ